MSVTKKNMLYVFVFNLIFKTFHIFINTLFKYCGIFCHFHLHRITVCSLDFCCHHLG